MSHIVWNTYNKTVAKKNAIEHFVFPVHSFEEYRRESWDSDEVHFFFNDKFERLPISSEEIDFYINQNPADYKIELTLPKGLWEHYLVEDWEVLEK